MKTYTILIADDNPDNIQLIVDALKCTDLQHKIIRAVNGKILCELAEKRNLDLIITDWEMPEMDGIEAIKILKQNKATKDIPIIMCTGKKTTSENLKMAFESGAVDFIRKPIDSFELQARVFSMLKLNDSYLTIKEQNTVLNQKKSELESFNEELAATNEKIFNQKQEIDATLNSLKETQRQLVQSEKMASIGLLAAGITHEINNPLNYIQGSIEIIENYFDENLKDHKPNIEFFINGIREGVKRATDIISGLNHFSRTGNFISDKIDIHIIIDNCLLLLHHEIVNKITIVKNYTNNPFTIIGNEGNLHQAIFNIIANAEQSIEGKGTININTKVENSFVVIKIEDSGSGISQENILKIFDPFFTTKALGKGTGLGLSTTYNIIQEHQGTIEIESQLGKGTTAIVKLPINFN